MQKLTKRLLLLCAIVFAAVSAAGQPAPSTLAPNPKKGTVRVKMQADLAPAMRKVQTPAANAPDRNLRTGIESIDASLLRIKASALKPVFPCAPDRLAEHQKYGLDLWFEITFDESIDAREACTVLRDTPGITEATTKVPMVLLEGGEKYRVLEDAPQTRASNADMPFDDPRLPLQWHYQNDGSVNGSAAGADINLFKAWEITTGSPDVLVAIIDGGIDVKHEDLAANIWVNEAELNGRPGVDDDGDGYIDDINGYNFCTNNGEIYPHSHGTHVAGTVGAVNNNGRGVAGVAGGNGQPNSGVKMMSCQVFDPRSGAGDGDFAAAIVYAADKGATIAQCSWGWGFEGYYEQDVLDAIRYFTGSARSNNMTGGLCIFAAGNEGENGYYYPGAFDEVLSVASMTCDMEPAPYSNHGPWVDVTAPGGLLDYDQAQGVLSTLPENTYGYSEGTSMATPHVSGIAALVLAKHGSPSLINESLRQQLITSVNDLYAHAPLAEGLFGSGYIDAWKALQWGDGTAPNPVTDLRVLPSQDNAVLEWTIPASSDNNVNSHIIYYGTERFDAQTLDKARTIIVDTKFNVSGDPFTYEVQGLSPMTTYYFAIAAVDRWSNASPLSEVVEATTNEGPKMTLSRTAMNIRTTDGNTWSQSTFDIGNTANGLLKWKGYMRTLSSSISTTAPAIHMASAPWRGRVMGMPTNGNQSAPDPEYIEDFEQDDFPTQFTNCHMLRAYIGEQEQDATNSMAQLFTVDPQEYPDGFNLTHINMMGNNGINPTIEIYRNGGTLSKSTLLTSTTKIEESPYYTDLSIPESVYFGPGESFYVVVHFKETKNRPYPLGLGESNGSHSAPQAYMSTDLGQTWTLLAEALRGSVYEEMGNQACWAISAISKFPDWSQILEMTPCEGTVEGGGSNKQTVTVRHNGTRIPNGSYRARILFDTNETEPSGRSINVNLSVAGYQPDVTFNKVVQFGNVLVGQSKSITIRVANKGWGAFAGADNFPGIFSDNITSSSPHFPVPDGLYNGIPARSYADITLTYTPLEEGSHSGQVVFTDKGGHKLVINVQGAATNPAKIETNPRTIDVGDLDVDGPDKEVSFAIANTGNYPLTWVMPKFSDEQIEGVAAGSTHRFGYDFVSNLYGSDQVQYQPAPTIIDAKDAGNQVGDYDYFSDPIDIGFKFPFYGKNYDQIYISSLGMLTFGTYTEGSIFSPVSETSDGYLYGLGCISAFGFECAVTPSSKIEYGNADGRFVVNFKDVLAPVYDSEKIPVSYHIALSPNGDIEISYDDYNPNSVFERGHLLWTGIVDPEMEDPLTITSQHLAFEAYFHDDTSEPTNRWRNIHTGNTFLISAPRPDLIRSIAPATGIVAPGQQMEVKATVGATPDMYAGPTNTRLVIQSNDVTNPTYIVNLEANITGDLHGELELSTDAVDFGNVFRTASARKSISVRNVGRNSLTLESATLQAGKFTHDLDEAAVIPAGQSKDIIVTLPTAAEGSVEDVLTIATSEGTRTVSLKGTVIGVPELQLNYSKVEVTVPYGESAATPLEITNTGNEPLVFSITPGNHVTYQPEFEEGASVEYTYVAALDDESAKRDWVDIETTGLGQQHNYTFFLNRDIVPIDLPFTFNYYGKNYDKMYIYDAGFVSFTERNDEGMWPEPPVEFPAGTIYNNSICPYWGLHTMDISSTAGVYHYETDDMAVVSFIEYGNSMNFGVDFQLIIRKDGTFTFNYKKSYENGTIFAPFGIVGISDENGQGLRLPERYIEFGNTVNFTPVVESTVMPGESKTADISILADDLAGEYTGKLTVNTNVPSTPTVNIPVKLTITGESAAVFPEELIVSEFVASQKPTNYQDDLIALGALHYAPINVRNEGAAAFKITGIDVDGPKADGFDVFQLYTYGPHINPWTGGLVNSWDVYRGETLEVGRSQLRLALPFVYGDASYQAWQTPGTYDIKLTLHLEGVAGVDTKEVNVRYIVHEQPTIALSTDEIRVDNAEEANVSYEKFIISNADGLYKLDYTITVDPSGAGAIVDDGPSYSSPTIIKSQGVPAVDSDIIEASAQQLVEAINTFITRATVGDSDFIYNCPTTLDIEYRRALYHPALESSTVAFNYGTTTKYGTYKAATAYEGPEGGFTISHIYSMMHPYNLSNKQIKVEIYASDPQHEDDIIGTGHYDIGEVTTQLYENVCFIVPLDRPVYIAEGQPFWVVITYPVGQEYPAGLVVKEEQVVSNRYMGYWDNYGWFDVATLFSANYGSLGYISTCLETVEGDAWVKVLDAEGNSKSVISGEILPGESEEISVKFTPFSAPKTKGNKAMLIVESNDPKQPVINLPVFLDKNSAPVIKAPTATINVGEGTTTSFSFTVTEPEAEDFSISLRDNGQNSAIKTVTTIGAGQTAINDEGNRIDVTGADSGVRVEIELAPQYGLEGNYNIYIDASDSRQHNASATVNYNVDHVNRAPVAVETADITVAPGSTSAPISLASLFTDPDGDELTYTATIDNTRVARLYMGEGSIIVEALKKGEAHITVTATDPAGAQATNTINVHSNLSGIDGISILEGVNVYPNPVLETLYVSTADTVDFSIFSLTGAQVVRKQLKAAEGPVHSVDVAHLSSGIYLAKVTAADGRTASRVIIKK